MDLIYTQTYTTPIGKLLLGSYGDRLCLCEWEDAPHREEIDWRVSEMLQADYQPGTSAVLEETVRQLDEYFAGTRRAFSLPISQMGTEFQLAAWDTLQQIPYGMVWTYTDQADFMGCHRSCRAVARANGANALVLIVPCHRVVARRSKGGGYSGGADRKLWLLEWERKHPIPHPYI